MADELEALIDRKETDDLNQLLSVCAKYIRHHSLSFDQVMKERDIAEQAFSHLYFLLVGESPEWSNEFGYDSATESIVDAFDSLRWKVKTNAIIVTEDMVTRFLTWPLPDSVCSDQCVTERGYGKVQGWPPRSGTSLLTADEARKMLLYVLKVGGDIPQDETGT